MEGYVEPSGVTRIKGPSGIVVPSGIRFPPTTSLITQSVSTESTGTVFGIDYVDVNTIRLMSFRHNAGTTVRKSIGRRKRPFRGIPRVLSPECLQRHIVAAKNIAFSFSNVGYRFRKQAPGTQTAFTVATVLPHMPGAPGGCISRLEMIVSNPQPAIGQYLAVQ